MSKPDKTYPHTIIHESSADTLPPDQMDPDTVYLVKRDGQWYRVRFLCPCGCKDLYSLPLKPAGANTHADWDVRIEESGRVTLLQFDGSPPSVNSLTGCKSHFHLQDGRVNWC